MVDKISNYTTSFFIHNSCAWWDRNNKRFSSFTVLSFTHPLLTNLSFKMAVISNVHKSIQTFIYFKYNVPTITTVATSRSPHRFIFLTPESNYAITTVASFYIYTHLIDKHNCSPLIILNMKTD